MKQILGSFLIVSYKVCICSPNAVYVVGSLYCHTSLRKTQRIHAVLTKISKGRFYCITAC